MTDVGPYMFFQRTQHRRRGLASELHSDLDPNLTLLQALVDLSITFMHCSQCCVYVCKSGLANNFVGKYNENVCDSQYGQNTITYPLTLLKTINICSQMTKCIKFLGVPQARNLFGNIDIHENAIHIFNSIRSFSKM